MYCFRNWLAFGRSTLALLLPLAALSPAALAQDAEFNFSGALGPINANGAYGAGFTGQGVKVGVVDSGIDLRHPDLSAAGKFAGGIRFTTAFDKNANDPAAFTPILPGQNNDSAPGSSHGTMVSGFIAGSRNGSGMQGVAYNASLYVAAINTNPGNGEFDTQLSLSINQMVSNGVGIINFSLGQNSCAPGTNSAANGGRPCNVTDYPNAAAATAELPTFFATAQQAVNAGALMIFATGNEAQPSADILAGAPKLFTGLQRGWLAVGAIDAQGAIADYSNRCGVAAAWCLVAPGNLTGPVTIGTGPDGSNFKTSEGTSYAAPTVAGVAALTKQAFPWYTNFDLQQTLLTTATAMGTRTATSVTPDTVYGWGLVNADAAVKGYGAFVGDISLNTLGASSTFSNNIYGTGNVTKLGEGTLTFTGNNIYTGTTTVNGGTLQVDGTLVSSAATVGNGGTLSGIGTLAATTVSAGGTLKPGNATTPLGTLSVSRPLIFQQGSFFAVTAAPTGNSSVALTNGATATINGGTVQADFQPGAYISRQYTLISGGSVTGTFASLTNTNLPAGFTTSLAYTTASVLMNLQANLGGGSTAVAGGLSGNQQGVANALNTAFNSGSALPASFTPTFGLTGQALSAGLNQLTPQVVGGAQTGALTGAQQFGNDLMSCRSPGSDTSAVIREGQCVWAKARETARSTNTTADNLGASDRTSAFAAGAQVALAPGWFAGTAVGYDTSHIKTDVATGTTERINAGLTLKFATGPWQIAGGLSGGWGNVGTTRTVTIPGLAGTLTGKSDLDTYAAHARAAYLFDFRAWYLKPLLDARITRVDYDGTTERGGPAALQLLGRSEWVSSLAPALEIGANMPLGRDASFRPFARAGLTFASTDAVSVTAQFTSVPGVFTTTTYVDRRTADVAAGFDIVARSGASLRLEYDGRFGENATQSSFLAKAALPF